MKAKLINENGISWSGKDPTRSPIIGKILTRRINLGDRIMEPEILPVVEISNDVYIINRWYKPGVPQIVHSNMVNHFIPSEKYKDEDLEDNFYKGRLKEVLSTEDKWADDQIDRWKKRDEITVPSVNWAKEPVKQDPPSDKVLKLSFAITHLEDWIYRNGTEEDRDKWRNYVMSLIGDRDYTEWIQLDEDELELAYMEANSIKNKIKRRM